MISPAKQLLVISCLLFGNACTSFDPVPLSNWPDAEIIQTQSQAGLAVSAAILSDTQSEELFGVDLVSVGLQAIWLRVDNSSQKNYWFLVASLDPNYFAPDEAAALFYVHLPSEDEVKITQHFRRLAMPLHTEAGSTSEGYVLAPRHEGGRFLTVPLVGHNELLEFNFAIVLPDGEFDFERLDPQRIYQGKIQPDLDLEQLRTRIAALPCCTTNDDGDRQGDPINLVVVGSRESVLAALSRGGWSFTHAISVKTVERMIGAAISGAAYPVAPVSPLYFFGREQDVAFQRPRNTIVQRNHLRLWLAPFRHNGKPVWVGQVSRDVNIKLTTKSPTLTTHVIDPNIDEAREHVLQSLIANQSLARFAFLPSIARTTVDAPAFNLSDDPYFTDGNRLVLWVSGRRTISPAAIEYIHWGSSADPTLEAYPAASESDAATVPPSARGDK